MINKNQLNIQNESKVPITMEECFTDVFLLTIFHLLSMFASVLMLTLKKYHSDHYYLARILHLTDIHNSRTSEQDLFLL